MTEASDADSFRSGFASIVGRPNVGKSTLLNLLVRDRVAITSEKPQTTRNAIRAILNEPGTQAVFIDTPGFHKPRNLLGERMNAVVRRTLSEVDAIIFMLDASQDIGQGDAFIAGEVLRAGGPVLCVINKADLVTPDVLLEQMERSRRLGEWTDVLTTSCARGTGIDEVRSAIVDLLPEGPRYYPEDTVTDQPENLVVAELVREQVLSLTREEVPHSVAVVVDEIERREGQDLIDIHADIFVARNSQKGILIGRGGRMLKEIGTRARKEIEGILGSRVFLDLRVKVEPHWQKSEHLLDRFGYR